MPHAYLFKIIKLKHIEIKVDLHNVVMRMLIFEILEMHHAIHGMKLDLPITNNNQGEQK